jgi:hypothetical protein
LPDRERLHALVREEAAYWAKSNPGKQVRTDRKTLGLVTRQLRGLATLDARRIIRSIIFDDGAIRAEPWSG